MFYNVMLNSFDSLTLDAYILAIYDSLAQFELDKAISNIQQIVKCARVVEATGLEAAFAAYQNQLENFKHSESDSYQKDALTQFSNLLNQVLSFKERVS